MGGLVGEGGGGDPGVALGGILVLVGVFVGLGVEEGVMSGAVFVSVGVDEGPLVGGGGGVKTGRSR